MARRKVISEAASRIESSPTLAVSSQAAALKAAGKDVIAFAAGEPDLPAPRVVQEAGIEAIRQDRGRYTAASGMPSLREAAAARFRSTGLPYSLENVIITAGAKPGLFLGMYAVCEPGDEVIYPAPFWSSYPDIARSVGAVPVAVTTRAEDGFQLDVEAIARAVTKKSRILLINSPNNPTGAVYTKECLEGVAEIMRQNEDLILLSDDIYEHYTFGDEPFRNVLHVAPELFERVISINGLSKSHSMTGWRIGFVGASKEIASVIGRVQSQVAGSPPSISQYASLAALGEAIDPERSAVMARRRILMLDLVRAIDGVNCPEPHGAFYLFPDMSAFFGRRHQGTVITDDRVLATQLLEKKLVATLSGAIFGGPGHLRLSYACSEAEIREGVARIAAFVSELEK